jgi:hypothetical protein
MFEYMKIKDGPVIEGMEAEEIVYAADQPQYLPLRTLKSKGEWGRVISRWTFTPKQRQAIADGADVLLELSTFNQPLQPIRMMVSDGNVDAEWVRVVLLEDTAEGRNH